MKFRELEHTKEYLDRIVAEKGSREKAAKFLGISERSYFRWEDKALTQAEIDEKYGRQRISLPDPNEAITRLKEAIKDMDPFGDHRIEQIQRRVFGIGSDRKTGRDFNIVKYALSYMIEVLREDNDI